MNVGEFVDKLMGHDADFGGEVVPEDAMVAVLLSDGTIVDLTELQYEPEPDGVGRGGTLWLKGEYA